MEKKQLFDVLMLSVADALANVHTSTIARVTAVNATTINCQPVISRLVKGQPVALPEFVDVPPITLQGGGSSLQFPVAVGDYCILIFTERCFDNWYAGNDGQPPLELRMHDYSDGFALVGVNPAGSALIIPSVTQIVGAVELVGALDVDGDVTATGNTEAATYSVGGTAGASGAFVSQDGKAVTVVNGIVTVIA